MNIRLNFVNNSSLEKSANVVIYQQNAVTLPGTPIIAWTVIQNCGFNCNHPFVLEQYVQVSVADSNGNYSPRLQAMAGQAFKAVTQASGHNLVRAGTSSNNDEIQVRNELEQMITAYAYRDGRMVSRWNQVGPGDVVAFGFKPSIFIGVVPDVKQGQTLDPSELEGITTELSLLGVESAQIIMTGLGTEEEPYQFKLKNTFLT